MTAVVAVIISLDQRAPIDYYRLADDHTVTVGAGTGPTLWARVTTVTETDSSVTIGVSGVRAPLPSTSSQVTELTVTLQAPLNDRSVIDASSGLLVPRR